MKNIIYIFSAILFFLFSCTNEEVDTMQRGETSNNKVRLNFTVNDLPDFTVVTKSGGESEVENMSLMTFAENGEFLGRVVAKISQTSAGDDGEISRTGSALVPMNTSTIHFIANYNWGANEYVVPNGETETSLMNNLTTDTDNFYVAWGKIENVDFNESASVALQRNYAKVTVSVSDKCNNFAVGGFALANYADKGYVTFSQEGELNEANFSLVNQHEEDCNTSAKYMYEYRNLYDNQTCVIVKKEGVKQYYKIQLLNDAGLPYKIERNYEYQIIIHSFAEEAKGSERFDEALSAVPTNDIFAEVIKKAPTVSDADKNKLTVTPVYHLFTSNSKLKLTFSANYWKNGSLSNDDIIISLIQNGHQTTDILPDIKEGESYGVEGNGTFTTPVALPSGDISELPLDSATLKVKAGVLTRIVTVMISKIYSFNPQTIAYTGERNEYVDLKFTIPADFPEGMLPIKCSIKADGLNPVKTDNVTPLLVEQKDGTVNYIYEVNSSNFNYGKEITLPFKTIVTGEIPDPTIENEYFHPGVFDMQKKGKLDFKNVQCENAFYETGSTFELTFTMSNDAKVTIQGDGIQTQIFDAKNGVNTVKLTTTKNGATSSIKLSADGYNNKSVEYSNSYTLKNDYPISNAVLKYRYYHWGWYEEPVEKNISLTVTPLDYINNIQRPSKGKYNMIIKSGTDVNERLKFSCIISRSNYSASVKVSDLFGGKTDILLKP